MSFFERMKVSVSDDPLSRTSASGSFSSESRRNSDSHKVKTESLTIRLTDELRIVGAMVDAAKKKTNGHIFTVRVDTSKSTSLCIGVKDLQDKLLAVSMLKRVNGVPGPVEQAGVRLGDVIFGINFQPCRNGSRTLLHTVKKELERKRATIHLQVRRHRHHHHRICVICLTLSSLCLCCALLCFCVLFSDSAGDANSCALMRCPARCSPGWTTCLCRPMRCSARRYSPTGSAGTSSRSC